MPCIFDKVVFWIEPQELMQSPEMKIPETFPNIHQNQPIDLEMNMTNVLPLFQPEIFFVTTLGIKNTNICFF